MRFLLDTHTFLWSLSDEDRLSVSVRTFLDDPSSELHLSIASLWEATIKIASGKIHVPGQKVDYLIQQAEQTGLIVLPILPRHLQYLQTLPRYHGDPFDRILVAQSVVEQLPLLSIDSELPKYPANIIW